MVSGSLESLKGNLETWKRPIKSNGLKVNVTKTTMIVSRHKAKYVRKKDNFSYAFRGKVVGSNSIRYQFCKC